MKAMITIVECINTTDGITRFTN